MRTKIKILLFLSLTLWSCSKEDHVTKEADLSEPVGELYINFLNQQLLVNLETKVIQPDASKSYNHVTESNETIFIADRVNNIVRAYGKSNNDHKWTFTPDEGENEQVRLVNSKVHYDSQTNSVFLHYQILNTTNYTTTYKTVRLSAETGHPQLTLSPDRETHYHTTLGNNYVYLDRQGTNNATWMLNKLNSALFTDHTSVSISSFPLYLTTHNNSIVVVYANGDIIAYNDALAQVWVLQIDDIINIHIVRDKERLYVSSRNNNVTEVDLTTGESIFSADTDYDRAIPLGADTNGIFWIDANDNGISVKKANRDGSSAWSTTIDSNLTPENTFTMKGIDLTNHLLVVVAHENSDENYTTDIYLIQKNNGKEIWKKRSESMNYIIQNVLVKTANNFYYSN
ncbi:PQQ-binding-like beta-propeller repeat protein [Alkaliflexus imshenetskii]|uniref:PQQ-binding-like beta-propeller repeat protein n=1 Tax=Alkaliflexus imshenetskii TaxID=286730 RepID=UPI00047BCA9F|nr:PQQ-binding-like beta-propeller repeat protein [Alkaliflexus imshenetskii]